MDLNNIYGDYLVKRRVTMMLQFVYKGDYTLAVQLYHNHALYGRKYFNMLLMGFCYFHMSFYSFPEVWPLSAIQKMLSVLFLILYC